MTKIAIDEEEYKLRFPNFDKFDITEIDKDVKFYYLSLYTSYMKSFTEYLIKNTNIKKYDDELLSSNLKFYPVLYNNKDVYQKLNQNLLKYFYIRNNIYITRLSKEELKFLEKMSLNDRNLTEEEINSFIEKTYRKLIFEGNIDDICYINYGPESPNFFAPNNALVIGVRYDEYINNKMSNDEWNINHDKQREYLNDVISRLREDINSNVKADVYVIYYDEFSIKKKINKENSNNDEKIL